MYPFYSISVLLLSVGLTMRPYRTSDGLVKVDSEGRARSLGKADFNITEPPSREARANITEPPPTNIVEAEDGLGIRVTHPFQPANPPWVSEGPAKHAAVMLRVGDEGRIQHLYPPGPSEHFPDGAILVHFPKRTGQLLQYIRADQFGNIEVNFPLASVLKNDTGHMLGPKGSPKLTEKEVRMQRLRKLDEDNYIKALREDFQQWAGDVNLAGMLDDSPGGRSNGSPCSRTSSMIGSDEEATTTRVVRTDGQQPGSSSGSTTRPETDTRRAPSRRQLPCTQM